MNAELKDRFNNIVYDYIRRSKVEAKYNPTRFIQMVDFHGCLETARILINSSKESEGYTTLYLKGRLDLTIEAIIFDNPEFQLLFTEYELNKIKKRLIAYNYKPAIEN